MFDDFIQWFNEDVGEQELNGPVHLDLDFSFERHFVHPRQEPGVRMSSLGKPAMLIALQKLGYIEPDPKGKLRYIFFLGDVFENVLGKMLEAYGYNVLSDQTVNPDDTKVKWRGITGHYDFVVEVDGVPTLVEAKTMSANYARTFRQMPNDDRGYLTQLALYSAATGLPAVWLCMDKGSGEIFQVTPNPVLLQQALLRAEKVLDRLGEVETLEDAFRVFRPPPGRPEVYRKQETGRLLVPQSLSWSPFKTALYKITQDINGYNKMTDYVEDYADAEHARQELQFLVETGKVVKDA